MNKILASIAAICVAAPLQAATYNINLILGTSGSNVGGTGSYYTIPSGGNPVGPTNVVVAGTVQTDDTIGPLVAANILAWDFSFSTNGVTQRISSSFALNNIWQRPQGAGLATLLNQTMQLDDGALIATATGLNIDGTQGQVWFNERAGIVSYDAAGNRGGSSSSPSNNYILLRPTRGGLEALSRVSSATQGPNNTILYDGGYASNRLAYAQTMQFATLSVVPLPAAGFLYGVGVLGAGIFLRRRKRKQPVAA